MKVYTDIIRTQQITPIEKVAIDEIAAPLSTPLAAEPVQEPETLVERNRKL